MFISAKDSLNKSVLTTEDREDLKQKQFALPKKAEDKEEKGESGNYPIPDLSHARNALAMVAQHGSSSEQARVRAAVYKKYPELDKRKEEEQEKSIFISAQDSLSKAVTDKTPKARVGYPAVTHERTTAQETDLVSVYDEAGKLVYRGSKAGAPKVGQPVIPREVVSADSGGYEVVSVADAKKRRAQKAQQTLQTAKGANRLFKEMQQYANQKPKLPYQLGDFAKQKEARVKTKGVPVKTKEVPEEARVKTKGVPVKTKEVPEEVPFVKSLDPVLAARMNMKPMSVPGAVGHPSIGQIGFHNTTIAANFYTNSEVTLGEKTLPVLKRPNR